ncbi:hypothetical protein PZ938_19275 [Luteipulveratus sp. YIM 133132]|uniref:hypothetical protein n=1 Tax=Luteipulveratus flavus TaxID=3031728 RepID=UPI0023B1CBA4|nr:hypothetical protein [Luteipulveratus sp. YIM 133132]MDE9367765.1 hypothetical protein [Luteipulveratus sp. YIM 133132]
MNAAIVIDNPTGRAVELWSGAGAAGRCTPKYAVQLVRRGIDNTPAFTAECGSGPLRIAPGQTRMPVTALTTYTHCTQDTTPAGSPRCEADGAPPGLPQGRYTARVVGNVLNQAPGVPVEVVAAT